MNHGDAAGINLNLVTCTGNDGGGRSGNPFHNDRLFTVEPFQGIVNGNAGKQISAATVKAYDQIVLSLTFGQIVQKAFRRDIVPFNSLSGPEVHGLLGNNIAVKHDLRGIGPFIRNHVPEFRWCIHFLVVVRYLSCCCLMTSSF